MTHKIIKFIAVLAMGTMLPANGEKDNKDNGTIVGKWFNTAQSYEITIRGQKNIFEGCISMYFTSSKVYISDCRVNCVPKWQEYTLTKESDKQLLEIDEGGCCDRIFVIEELTDDKLVLRPKSQSIDWDFRYIMKRNEASE